MLFRSGRMNPYVVYDRLRASGPLTPTRLGHWVSTSHSVCESVLRDRRFAVRPEDAEPGQRNMSFLDALARSEAAISLRMLAERMPDLAHAGTVKRRNATIIRGPVRLPVKHGPVTTTRT